ncbi:MAG: ATP-binding cassette domain-containing protein [Planctomycetota bacterium]
MSAAEANEGVLVARNVRKVFRTYERRKGLKGILGNFVNRDWKEFVALDGIELSVRRGERVGLIGANGAGKTTLIKVLTGIVPATTGEARLLGRDSFGLRDVEKRRLALVMGQKSQLWWDLPPLDSFRLLKEVYGVAAADFDARVAEYSHMLEVEDKLGVPLRQLSLGQRMKMELIGAFLHAPEIVFLDEPTIGLDLVSRETIRAFLVRLGHERGITMVLTSHDMEDIEDTCERLVILDRGRILYDGELAELSRRVSGRRALEVHLEPREAVDEARLGAVLAAHGAELAGRTPHALTLLVETAALTPLMRQLFDAVAVRDLAVEPQPLELLVKDLYRGAAVPEAAAHHARRAGASEE